MPLPELLDDPHRTQLLDAQNQQLHPLDERRSLLSILRGITIGIRVDSVPLLDIPALVRHATRVWAERPSGIRLRSRFEGCGCAGRESSRVDGMRDHPTLLHGIGIGSGAAAGNVLRMPPPLAEPAADQIAADPTEEYARAARALAETAEQLAATASGANQEARSVLGAQALMAQDPTILEDVRARTTAGRSAERAVFESFQAFQVMFESAGGVMAGRVADLRDVSARVIARLRGLEPPGIPDSDDPFILVADDLAPVDTASIDLRKVLAIVTREGGPTSHTAILARSMGLVAVVGVPGSDDLPSGSSVLVDARTGTVSVDPSDDVVGTALD
ncbi:MAG: PEP-utilizing enzyme, partial [Candidatus Dormiibacterota bacterium]